MEASRRHSRYFLLSLKLWKHLLCPRENAIFERTITQNDARRLTIYHLCLMMLVGGVISYGAISFLSPLGTAFPVMAMVVLAIFSSIFAVIWLVTIATTITHEYQQATYDLICVTPLGKMGVNWSIMTGILHRQDLFRSLDAVRRWFSGLILLVFLSVLLPVILSTVGDNRNSSLEGIMLILNVLGFVIYTYIEYIQSVLQGVLIGVLISRFARRTDDVAVWATFIYVTLQIVMLTVFLIVGFLIHYIFILNHWQHLSILPQLLLLFAMREACIYSLWKLLSHQLNAETDDLKHVTQH